MTPLTITVAVWNYCQNACPYCVSGSNQPEWTYRGNFETWTPSGGEHLNDLQLREKYGKWYFNKLCPDKERYLNRHNVLELPYLLYWLQRHTPNAVVHLSGGEPLLRPDIEAFTRSLVQSGFEVTIFTNGLLIPERPELLALPLKWVATHHDPQPLTGFLECIEPIRTKPHQITRVLHPDDTGIDVHKNYPGFNFVPRWRYRAQRKTWFVPRPGEIKRIASSVLHFITPDGRVFPCNTMFYGHIGHIYTGEYYPQNIGDIDWSCSFCIRENSCGAYQSAVEVDNLKFFQ